MKNENKGFSLVELVIVIAIMAILSAALAPSLIKYIEKSRVYSDKSTAAEIQHQVLLAVSEDKVNDEIYSSLAASSGNVSFEYDCSASTATNDAATAIGPNFQKFIDGVISLDKVSIKSKKNYPNKKYTVVITLSNNNIIDVTVTPN